MMTHRKFRRLVALTGLPEAHVRGLLECLWEVTYETGDPFVGDSTDVEAAARWTGRPGDLTAALLAAGGEGHSGYIDPAESAPGRYVIHDLYDHAPEYVKNRWRREQGRRAAGSRFREELSVSDRSVTDQRPITDRTLRATLPPKAVKTVKEEKKNYFCGEASPGEEKILLVFPCVRGAKVGRDEWWLLETFVADVESTFPQMDVLGEARKALLWLKANGLKTYAGMPRFLNGWFSRANDRRDFIGRSSGSVPRAASQPAVATVVAPVRAEGDLSPNGKFRWVDGDWSPVEEAAAVASA